MPEVIWSSIQSGVILYHFPRVVEELVSTVSVLVPPRIWCFSRWTGADRRKICVEAGIDDERRAAFSGPVLPSQKKRVVVVVVGIYFVAEVELEHTHCLTGLLAKFMETVYAPVSFIFCYVSFLPGNSNFGVLCFPYTSEIKIQPSDDMHAFPETFGFKGEALSYISDVSLLDVVTKTHWRPNEYRKVLKDLVSHEMNWC
ncbi:uncharacterized protein LOC129872128 isoform X2 [Solanum dulcamara]|uniref:uncharacterized protein LOC129872128 isoform X2 n=1 Tax=Solanum dulcamara TaxID=45834 RepID=UPI002484ED33|nr:uncharacterized protein LOC129872128 isoform X2 [Solanum dulcamara]